MFFIIDYQKYRINTNQPSDRPRIQGNLIYISFLLQIKYDLIQQPKLNSRAIVIKKCNGLIFIKDATKSMALVRHKIAIRSRPVFRIRNENPIKAVFIHWSKKIILVG